MLSVNLLIDSYTFLRMRNERAVHWTVEREWKRARLAAQRGMESKDVLLKNDFKMRKIDS